MSWPLYAVTLAFTLLAVIYGAVILFSHHPRPSTPSELKYSTNDKKGPVHDLPPRVNSTTATKGELKLTVVVPCYNETARLGKMLEEAAEYLQTNHAGEYEILIVDDGSSDSTTEYALEQASQLDLPPHLLKVVKLAKNRGKGGAVTHGILHGKGEYLLFADADGATKFSDVSKLLAYLESVPADIPAIAIGLRAHMVNTDAVVKRLFIRNFLMYGLHTLVYIFGIRDVQDTQCGFKMFNRASVSKIFPHMHTERWIFDVEILLLGEIQDMAMKEVPVNWQEIDGSKVDLAKDSIQMAVDLVVTRMAYIFGIYGLDECGRKTT